MVFTLKLLKVVCILVLVLVVLLLAIRAVNQYLIAKEGNKLEANGGLSELVELEVNGTKQYLLLEGKKKEKPIILFLHGGPGQPFPFGVSARGAFPQITEDFIAVYYDQRGSGKSYHKDIPLDSMNIEQFVKDTDVIVDYLLERFDRENVIIAGVSWGSIIGTKYSQSYPTKVHAYIGISQFVNDVENQKRAKEWLTEIASSEKNEKMLNDMESLEEPPYFDEKDKMLSKYISKYGGDNYSDQFVEKASIYGLIAPSLISPDYTLIDLYKAMISGATFSLFKAKDLQKEMKQLNLVEEVRELQVPVYIFQGKHDKITNYELTKEYTESLIAPAGKEIITLEQSAHYPNGNDLELIFTKLKEISLKEF
ncbi:pimeloyl-ACP methyl ester carboxylesterase [Ureibacillus xyleni]|uniref:prolyl aminopeptidase n=1 Tax=Ureibacillus xyleni TaxID=614648 RepID=A0A285SQQ9_9BACL|nr:alpha/beta fold hydrolase [Ureibacillus xyleni]SOC08567.1 pimeloyl-ACP methyl ester carboxylesterase [Ureibacillus xyleni]